jgi:hypothetical protein
MIAVEGMLALMGVLALMVVFALKGLLVLARVIVLAGVLVLAGVVLSCAGLSVSCSQVFPVFLFLLLLWGCLSSLKGCLSS